MDRKKSEILSIVEKGTMDAKAITEAEKEIALKILEDLDGVLVIRAKSILEFCLKAIQYTSIKGMQYKKETAHGVEVQEQLIKEILSEISILLITASSITRKALGSETALEVPAQEQYKDLFNIIKDANKQACYEIKVEQSISEINLENCVRR